MKSKCFIGNLITFIINYINCKTVFVRFLYVVFTLMYFSRSRDLINDMYILYNNFPNCLKKWFILFSVITVAIPFRDQAEQWWEKRQKEWDSEKAARKQLLQDVLDERREQLQEKLEDNRNIQHDIIKDRENLLMSIENEKRRATKEQETQRQKQTDFVTGIRQQLELKDEKIRDEIDQIEKGKT